MSTVLLVIACVCWVLAVVWGIYQLTRKPVPRPDGKYAAHYRRPLDEEDESWMARSYQTTQGRKLVPPRSPAREKRGL